MKPRKGPVIRLSEQTPDAADVQDKPKRSAIVEPKRRGRFGNVPELTEEDWAIEDKLDRDATLAAAVDKPDAFLLRKHSRQ